MARLGAGRAANRRRDRDAAIRRRAGGTLEKLRRERRPNRHDAITHPGYKSIGSHFAAPCAVAALTQNKPTPDSAQAPAQQAVGPVSRALTGSACVMTSFLANPSTANRIESLAAAVLQNRTLTVTNYQGLILKSSIIFYPLRTINTFEF